jgi:hypothetical protein
MDLILDIASQESITNLACEDNTRLYPNVKNSAKFDVKIGYAIVDIAGMDFTNFILSCDFKTHLSDFTLYRLYTPNPIIFIILVYFTQIEKFGLLHASIPAPAHIYQGCKLKCKLLSCKHF